MLRGLEDDAVARRQHVDHRANGEVERKIPRHDIADHAFGLTLNIGTRRTHHGGIGLSWRRLHPALEPFEDVPRASNRTEHLDEVRSRLGMTAEILSQRSTDVGAMRKQRFDEPTDARTPTVERGIPVDIEGRALCREHGLEFGRGLAVIEGQ